MIFLKDKEASESEFLQLLDRAKPLLLSYYSINSQIPNGNEFEDKVFSVLDQISQRTEFEGKIVQTGSYAFPDVTAAKFFGIEVKMTKSDKWISTGNSVLESTRTQDVEKIFIYFGKFGGAIDFKYRLYQECLNEVGVTHSPRYKINMLLESGKSIFDKMETSYDEIRINQNPISIFKKYYKSQLKKDEELWWIDQSEETSVSPVIRSFRGMGDEEKNNFICDVFIFFPEIFGTSNSKFERPAAMLITTYNAVSSSLRDIFTAGGRESISVGGNEYLVPRIVSEFYKKRKQINNRIDYHDLETFRNYWRIEGDISSPKEKWFKMLRSFDSDCGIEISLVDIFKS